MIPAEALYDYLIANGYTSGYRVQLFQWNDGEPDDKFIVVQQSGGMPAEVIRDATCVVTVIGETNGDRLAAGNKANDIFEALRVATVSDGAFYFQPDEPQYFFTEEQRPVFQMNVRVLAD
jgi:hypothetical protein